MKIKTKAISAIVICFLITIFLSLQPVRASYINWIEKVLDGNEPNNSIAEMQARTAGFHITKTVSLSGTGSNTVNALQLTGTVRVLNQWAIITEADTLTNLTNMYATLYDGTNTVNLTADGMSLSGASVGSFFTKDQVAAQTYSLNLADEARLLETQEDRFSGRPFLITQKNGADTFIQINFTTTDNPVDVDLEIHFEYLPMDGGTLTFL